MRKLVVVMMCLLAQGAYSLESYVYKEKLAKKAVVLQNTKQAFLGSNHPVKQQPVFAHIFRNMDFNRVEDSAVKIMMSHFTQDEIEALVNFLESSAGQSVTQKMQKYQKMLGTLIEEEMKRTFQNELANGTLPVNKGPSTPVGR